jgi:xanthine dehydrogenase accessory factor
LPFAVTWVDVAAARFPEVAPDGVAVQTAPDPAAVAAQAPAQAFHIVMTHSHPLDLAICHAVLARGAFGHLGLIGSRTKRARFLKRLRELGIAEEQLAWLACPIGVAGIEGKQPAIIAVAVAAELLQITQGNGAAARKPLAAGQADLE